MKNYITPQFLLGGEIKGIIGDNSSSILHATHASIVLLCFSIIVPLLEEKNAYLLVYVSLGTIGFHRSLT